MSGVFQRSVFQINLFQVLPAVDIWQPKPAVAPTWQGQSPSTTPWTPASPPAPPWTRIDQQ